MKKIAFYCFWTFICLHTTVTFADAATDTVDASLAQVDAIIADTESGITLESAPVAMYRQNMTPIYQTEYTAWELIHRTPMLQGFTWTGEIANFITPAMYMGTPLQTSANSMGYDTDIGATNYAECVRSETDASFGPDGALIEETTEDELRNMAKYCATEFLGSYFSGKDYTTREEMLMFVFTMFEDGIPMSGYFEGDVFVFDGEETPTTYSNVSSRAWFAPYLAAARELDMIPNYETWTVAARVTDSELSQIFDGYLSAYSDDQQSLTTTHGTYTMTIDTGGVTIGKTGNTIRAQDQKKAPEKTTQNISKQSRYTGCDTDDITLSNGQVWSACNVGSNKSGTGKESYGSYFQWGRNTAGWIKNWQAGDNSWGGGSFVSTYNLIGEADKKLMTGPCAENYHIPTSTEWCSAIDSINKTSNCATTYTKLAQNTLMVPSSGFFSAEGVGPVGDKTKGSFWMSTPLGSADHARYVSFSEESVSETYVSPTIANGSKNVAMSIRCIKN